MIRRTVVWLAIGFALGTFASMWYGPEFLTWWSTPPGGGFGAMCGEQVRWATHRLVQLQLAGGIGLGVVLAIVAGVMAGRKKAPPDAPAQ